MAVSDSGRLDLLQWVRALVRELQQVPHAVDRADRRNVPRCGNTVERGLIPGMTRPADEAPPAVPWHLKMVGVALALYLGYRFFQIIDWLLHR